MNRPRIITRRVALAGSSLGFCVRGDGAVVLGGELLAFPLPVSFYRSYVRTRVRVSARPTPAGARVVSLGPLSGNS